jgi:hypothetical protein
MKQCGLALFQVQTIPLCQSIGKEDVSGRSTQQCLKTAQSSKSNPNNTGFNERRSDTAADIEKDSVDGWMILGLHRAHVDAFRDGLGCTTRQRGE